MQRPHLVINMVTRIGDVVWRIQDVLIKGPDVLAAYTVSVSTIPVGHSTDLLIDGKRSPKHVWLTG